jgi:hypothetical protein
MRKNTVRQMIGNLINDPHPRGLIHCPITGIDVWRDDWASFLIPGGYATWWRCSACQGWHVLVMDDGKKVRHCL